MSIKAISPISFKGCLPVTYMARNPKNGKFVPVIKKENIKKCHRFLVSNLNGTAKKNRDDNFVNFYCSADSDYNKVRTVHSVYPSDKGPLVYIVTGSDVDKVNAMAKPLGIAKGEAIDAVGNTKTFEVGIASKMYSGNSVYYVEHECPRVLSKDDKKPLSLVMYFEPEYGPKSKKLKGFKFHRAQFYKMG